jgi:uncharacterized protein (TIGR03083 family)
MAKIEQLPMPPSAVQECALAELDHVSRVVESLAPKEWSRRSAVERWTVGDVVAHLDLFVGMYSRFLGNVLSGGGSSPMAKLIGWLTGSILPETAPVFDTINGAVPKVMNRLLAPDHIKRQFAAGARNTRDRLLHVTADDCVRPVFFEGGPYPLWFYLAIVVNELAIHCWDIESAVAGVAELSDGARGMLPWFYWTSTRLMFRPPMRTRGTVDIVLDEPRSALWWSLADGSIDLGRGTTPHPDAVIRSLSGAYVLALAGRLSSAEALQRSMTVAGDRGLAETFLASWHLI